MNTTAPWSELISAALLGAERRTPPGGSPEALLDAAAVRTVRQRAGLRPGRAGRRPAPAPDDPRPDLPPAARQRLGLLLADRAGSGRPGPGTGSGTGSGHQGSRGPAPDLTELLPQ